MWHVATSRVFSSPAESGNITKAVIMKNETSRVAAGHEQFQMANDANERLAKIKYVVRVQSDNRAYVIVEPGGRNQIVEVRVSDVATPTRLSRQLLLKKSLLLAPCSETADGHWPIATWNRFIAERLRVFESENEMLKWDRSRTDSDHAAFYAVGNFVRHPRYGIGRVSEIGKIMRRQSVTVEFAQDSRRETFIADKCPLTVVV